MISGYRGWKALPPSPDLLADSFLTPAGWEKVRAWQAAGGPGAVYAQLNPRPRSL